MYSSTKKILIIVLILLIVIAAANVGIVFLIKKNIARTAAAEVKLQERAQAGQTIRELQEFFGSYGGDIDKLASRIIAADDAVSFIEMLEQRARQRGLSVSIDSVNTYPIEGETKYELFELVLSTEGSWNGTYSFISLLDALPYKHTINKSVISDTSEVFLAGISSASGRWKATHTLSVIKEK